MNLLIYGINYAPELTGIGKYTGEMGAWLQKNGNQVNVVTGFPYYPQWKVQKPYRGWFWKREKIAGVSVTRCPVYVPEQPSAIKRIIHEFSFLLTSSIALFTFLFKPIDRMVCVVTPFHLGIPARLFAWIKGVPMIYHVQDLQVDAARDLKMIRQPWLLRAMEKAELWILKKTDVVSTISQGMIDKIKAKGISDEKIAMFPNWVDSQFIYPLDKKDSLRETFNYTSSDRIVMYSGNLGEKQGLDQIIEVARELSDQKDLYFLIVGEGGIKNKLIALAEKYKLTNVNFLPLQPYEQLAALLATADLHLVLQKKAAADLVMPSKLTTILAAGGCAVVTAEAGTTLYQVIQDNQLGIIAEPENVSALSDAIKNNINSNLKIYQQQARSYAQRMLDKDNILTSFTNTLSKMNETKIPSKKPADVVRMSGSKPST